ncbi:AAA family ATPase [Brevundimonas sp. TWP2-3-4b1]|uniref:AAA family ATPase n=1 Tax=Brevundimonas sp. TWP2-3-4b1 TaxID=2804580 RepID=UPI003CEEB86F
MTVALQTAIERLKRDLGVTERPLADYRPPFAGREVLRSGSEAGSPRAVAKLREALRVITSDVPRGNGSVLNADGNPADDYWLGVVWAIAGLNWPSGEALAREWSMTSARYDNDKFTKEWKAFNPFHSNPVGIGSVYRLAKVHGWVDDAHDNPLAQRSRYQILQRADIIAIPPIQWRVKGLLPTTGLAAIYGPSGSGKSFLALDLAFAIASEELWFDRRTTQCPVTYVMLEGEAGLHNRMVAWEKHHGKNSPAAFGAIVQPFGLMIEQDLADLGSVLPLDGVVIIDTLNRAAPTADENSSADMGSILKGAKQLQQITNGLVILVHHTGKDTSKGLRGHSSLHAALDAGVEVEHSASGRSWRVGKAKDGEDGIGVAFALRRIVLSLDSDGDEVTSCVVERNAGAMFAPREPSGKNQISALRAVRERLAKATMTGKARCGSQTRCITADEAKAAVVETLALKPTNKRNNLAQGLLDRLYADGFLMAGVHEAGEGWVWHAS